MDKKVYGALGISAIMSNWNANFDGTPKALNDGTIYGTDKALKFTMKRLWEQQGENVLYIKSMKIVSEKNGQVSYVPKTLKERYEEIFHIDDLKKEKNTIEVMRNIMSLKDVKNFGATFTEASHNFAIQGAVQIGQGINFYENTVVNQEKILSPFKNANEKDAKQTSIGTKATVNEAHYLYPFTINPLIYDKLQKLEITEGYTEKDYMDFKETALKSVSMYDSNTKQGCDNEFAIFIETEKDTYIPNILSYISLEEGENRMKYYSLSKEFVDLLELLGSRILKVEIFYNPATVCVNHIDVAEFYNIISREKL